MDGADRAQDAERKEVLQGMLAAAKAELEAL